ncbi:protein serine/threonine kinase protein [Trichomonas vaginalis G3]|uniref:protein serine/threonine kinase protein n=1 Tax=Trichomonas vaginalis (strain ATCC PRA-98 / G3) TaxID=412133 RepID=UPI0021E5380C|nr:protein serine/threonine kinase protein [Trichomonas vaginalis G3]KAI5508155.1 protein serine/threonine kinase protein [Trichomonas vaginalis G3]
MQDFQLPNCASKYKFIKPIGHGAFAVVALAQDTKTGNFVAIKLFNRKKVMEQDMMQYLESEIRIISRIHHPAFPEIYEILYEPEWIMVVMEYLCNGNVIELIQENVFFTYDEKIAIVKRIAEGLEYLHKRGIAHRDIKSENIVFDGNFNPKIIDFGLCKENPNNLETYCGTMNYMAPEVIKTCNYNGKKADIWSFAITAHVIMTSQMPINYMSEAKFVHDVKKGKMTLKNYCIGEMRTLIDDCLMQDPAKRPSAFQVVLKLSQMLNINKEDAIASEKVVLPKLLSEKKFIARCKTKKFGAMLNKNFNIPHVMKLTPNVNFRRVSSF